MEYAVRRKGGHRGGRLAAIGLAVVALIAIIVGVVIALRSRNAENGNYISRALASRMLVLLDRDMEPGTGQNVTEWYVKYMDELNGSGSIVWDSDEYAQPEYAYSALTYGQLRDFLVNSGRDVQDIAEHTDVEVKRTRADKKVKKAAFDKIYDYMVLVNGNAGGVIRRALTIIGTPANMSAKQIRQFGAWSCVAEEGIFQL